LVNAVNPGMAWTPGVAALTPEAVPQWRRVWPIVRWFQRRAKPERAALGPLHLALSPQVATGGYFDGLDKKPLATRLNDVDLQERVWALGELLVARAMGTDGQAGGLSGPARVSDGARCRE
jgi:hypothetical protein